MQRGNTLASLSFQSLTSCYLLGTYLNLVNHGKGQYPPWGSAWEAQRGIADGEGLVVPATETSKFSWNLLPCRPERCAIILRWWVGNDRAIIRDGLAFSAFSFMSLCLLGCSCGCQSHLAQTQMVKPGCREMRTCRSRQPFPLRNGSGETLLWLSTVQDSDSPRKHISGHACEGAPRAASLRGRLTLKVAGTIPRAGVLD